MASREASAGLAANSEVSCYSVVIARFLIVRLQSIAHARAIRQANHMSMTVSDHKQELRHYRLTTAEIIYHRPDHPEQLQSFIWQKPDLAPDFPELRRFLEFWSRNIEGELHSAKIGQARFAARLTFRHVRTSLLLH
jgi:uncharacterized protein Usg